MKAVVEMDLRKRKLFSTKLSTGRKKTCPFEYRFKSAMWNMLRMLSTMYHKHSIYKISEESAYSVCNSQIREANRGSIGIYSATLDINIGMAELTTLSRATAVHSFRNAVSFAACLESTKHIREELVINMDATQYTVGNNTVGLEKLCTLAIVIRRIV